MSHFPRNVSLCEHYPTRRIKPTQTCEESASQFTSIGDLVYARDLAILVTVHFSTISESNKMQATQTGLKHKRFAPTSQTHGIRRTVVEFKCQRFMSCAC